MLIGLLPLHKNLNKAWLTVLLYYSSFFYIRENNQQVILNTTLASKPNIALTVDVIGNDGVDGFDDVDYLGDGNMAVRFVIITHICIAKGVRRLQKEFISNVNVLE